MLSKPESGFVQFKLKDSSSYYLGYEDDIPFDWIKQTIHGLETGLPFCVVGETDPGTCICVVGWNCHILLERDRDSVRAGQIQHEYIPMNMTEFAKNLYTDISVNLEDWAGFHWAASENEIPERKEKLRQLLVRLKELIDEKA